MNRTDHRSSDLPVFQCDASDLRLLASSLEGFIGTAGVSMRIDVDLPGQWVTFDSPDEMAADHSLPSRSSDFRIRIFDSVRSKRIDIGAEKWRSSASVETTANAEGWCAGAEDIVLSFARRHRVWYSPLKRIDFLSSLIALAAVLWGLHSIGIPDPRPWPTGALIGMALLAFAFIRQKVLPNAILKLRDEPAGFRHYVPELTLAVTVLGVVVAVIAILLGQRAH